MPEETYQKLKSKLKELKPVVEKVKGLLEEYKHSADERLLGEIDEEMKKLGAVEGEIKEIKKFFEERAYKILKAWYPGEDFDEFYQNHVRRNEKMLIEIDELDLGRRGLEKLELPSIIENTGKALLQP
jgi:protein subunit release factor A